MRSASGADLGPATTEVRPKDLHAYGERTHFENSILDYALVARVPFAAFVLGFGVEVGKLFLRSKGEPFSYLMACPQCLETDI